MNSFPAFRSHQSKILELEMGESVRIGKHVIMVKEINCTEVKLFVEHICGDDVEDDFQFEDLSELLTANYESV